MTKEQREDYISKTAAIKVMEDLEQMDFERYGCSIPEGFDSRRAVEVLESLPSISDVLYKIRAEIEGLDANDEYLGYYDAIDDVLKIIDKYKEDSEEQTHGQ